MRLGKISEEIIRDSKWADQQYELAYDKYFEGDWLAAEQSLRHAIEISPFESRYRLLLAQVYCARGWLSMSFSELEGLRNLDPDNHGAKSLETLLRNKMRERQSVPRKRRRKGRSSAWGTIFNFKLAWFH